MPRVTYPVLSGPVFQPAPGSPVLGLALVQPQRSPAPPQSPAWLNAAGIVQPFVQSAATPSVAAWAGSSVSLPFQKQAAPQFPNVQPIYQPTPGSPILGLKLVQEPWVWPVRSSPNDGVRPVLPPTPVTPTLGWAMSQDARPLAALPATFVGSSFAGPVLAIPQPVFGWSLTQDARPPALPAPAAPSPITSPAFVPAQTTPTAWMGFDAALLIKQATPRFEAVQPIFQPSPGSPILGLTLRQDARVWPVPVAAPSTIVSPPFVQSQAVSLAWSGNDAFPIAKRVVPGFYAVQPPAVTPAPGSLVLGWNVQSAPAPQRAPFMAMPASVLPPVVSAPLVFGWNNQQRFNPPPPPRVSYSLTIAAPPRVLTTALPNVGWYGQPMQPPRMRQPAMFPGYVSNVTFVPASSASSYLLILRRRNAANS